MITYIYHRHDRSGRADGGQTYRRSVGWDSRIMAWNNELTQEVILSSTHGRFILEHSKYYTHPLSLGSKTKNLFVGIYHQNISIQWM